MSYKVKGTTITLTRGDTFSATIKIVQPNGEEYVCSSGDRIRFAAKANIKDEKPIIFKEIPIGTMTLTLQPEDTKELPFGTYIYDIELTKSTGEVDTFITKSNLVITEEVD